MQRGEDALKAASREVAERDRVYYEWMLGSIARFRMFFVGLVFALLAFSVQFAVPGAHGLVLYSQVGAWILLLGTGGLALRDAGGFVAKYTERVFEGLPDKLRIAMWVMFSLALVLLAISRVLSV